MIGLDNIIRKLAASPDWSHLHAKNLKKLKAGQFIKVPILPRIPKGITEGVMKNLVLTPQRLELLHEFASTLHLGERDKHNKNQECGMILSGPNGVGKSVESYLFACTAIVNQCLVIYIVGIPCSASLMFCTAHGKKLGHKISEICNTTSFARIHRAKPAIGS